MNNTFGAALTTCRRRARIRHTHRVVAGILDLATAIATGSITDSAAQDDISEKVHQQVLNAYQAHIWAKESCVPCLASGNSLTAWLSAD